MGHNVGKQAALAVAAGQKRGAAVAETRTPEEIIKTIRGNLNSPLAILKTDVALLMAKYDAAEAAVIHLGGATAGLLERAEVAEAQLRAAAEQINGLQDQVDRFREVYEMENRVQKVEFSPEGAAQLAAEAQETGSES
jgi:hypothetical protein